MSTSSRPWVIAGAVIALVLLAATWLLVLSPQRAQTQSLRDDTAAVQQQNATLQAQTDALSEQAENRDQLEDQLRAALGALPSDVSLPDFNRELAGHAAARGVTVSSIAIAPAVTAGEAGAGAAGDTGLLSIPITIQTSGPALSQLYFLRDVQEVGPRAALVTSTSLSAAEGTSVVESSAMTTQLTIFSSSLSDDDLVQVAEALGDDLAAG